MKPEFSEENTWQIVLEISILCSIPRTWLRSEEVVPFSLSIQQLMSEHGIAIQDRVAITRLKSVIHQLWSLYDMKYTVGLVKWQLGIMATVITGVSTHLDQTIIITCTRVFSSPGG